MFQDTFRFTTAGLTLAALLTVSAPASASPGSPASVAEFTSSALRVEGSVQRIELDAMIRIGGTSGDALKQVREALAVAPEAAEVRDLDLRFDSERSFTYGGGRQVVELRQYHDGILVEGARISLRFGGEEAAELLLDRVGRVDLDTRPALDSQAAFTRAIDQIGLRIAVGDIVDSGTLKIAPAAGGHRLIWEMSYKLEKSDDLYRLRVDAHDGEVLEYLNLSSNAWVAGASRAPEQGGAACVKPPATLFGWWPLDESVGPIAYELVTPRNGIHVGGPTPTIGMVSNSLFFDGIDDYVNVRDCSNHDLAAGDFTIDAWIWTDQATGTIVSKRAAVSGGWTGYIFGLEQDRLLLQMTHPSVGWTNFRSPQLANISDGNWHLVAVSVDRNSTSGGRMYVDGNLVHTFDPTAYVSANLSNNSDLRIGRNTGGGTRYFEGRIDEVEIFKRSLAEIELDGIFNAGPDGKCKWTRLPKPPRCTEVSEE